MNTEKETTTPAAIDGKPSVVLSLQPGDVIDINSYGDHWDSKYGIVDRIEKDGIVWTMRDPGHDGCCWTYKSDFSAVRLAG